MAGDGDIRRCGVLLSCLDQHVLSGPVSAGLELEPQVFEALGPNADEIAVAEMDLALHAQAVDVDAVGGLEILQGKAEGAAPTNAEVLARYGGARTHHVARGGVASHSHRVGFDDVLAMDEGRVQRDEIRRA